MSAEVVSKKGSAPGPIRLGLLGGFRLSVESEVLTLPLNSQRLVSFLALQARPLLRTYVSGSLWAESSDRHARGSLRSALTRLRHPRYSLVELTSDHIELSPLVTVDYREGEALARRVLDLSRDLDDVVTVDDEVLSADLLPDWTEDWVLIEREAYHQLRLRALETLCRRLTTEGSFGQAVQVGMTAVAGEPLRESPRRALIEAHLAADNVAAALREYEDFRQYLFDELGREPSAEMRRLIEGLKLN